MGVLVKLVLKQAEVVIVKCFVLFLKSVLCQADFDLKYAAEINPHVPTHTHALSLFLSDMFRLAVGEDMARRGGGLGSMVFRSAVWLAAHNNTTV